MRLVFKINLNDNLETTLAAGRYSRYWEENRLAILRGFYHHTGLHFKQRKITVHSIEDETSSAGNRHHPMRLSIIHKDHADVGCTLIHELAHRLLMGHGIVTPGNSANQNYYLHRHIGLFLYDVITDVLGKDAAAREISSESQRPAAYAKACRWAMAMTYRERQAALAKLKRRYIGLV